MAAKKTKKNLGGRPSKGDDAKKHKLSVMVSVREWNRLHARAALLGKPMGTLARELIVEGIK